MENRSGNNIKLHSIMYNGIKEYHITVFFSEDENVENKIHEIADIFNDNAIKPLYGFGFGGLVFYEDLVNLFIKNNINSFPITWTESYDNRNNFIDGIYIKGISGVEVETLYENGNIIGNYYEDGYAAYIYTGNITSETPELPDDLQTQLVFNKMESYLGLQNFKMTDLVRTWFYNRNILDWYGKFNYVRTDFYKEHEIFKHVLPASTGIDGKPFGNGALIASAIAVRPKDDKIIIKEVDSPLQNQATEYGSSFSRAVEIKIPGMHSVTVSGTASIDKTGKTVFLDDFDKQAEQTFNTVIEILKQCNMSFSDVCRAFAYVKHKKDITKLKKYLKSQGFEKVPFIITNTTICRGDLLFEIEVDAVKSL